MRDLTFAVEGAQVVPFAAVPTLAFHLHVKSAASSAPIESIALRCQIQIEAQRRHYEPLEKQALRDLFGEPERWSQTLRPFLWTHANVTVPQFSGSILVDLPVACSFDFNVAATKYFHALEAEEVPLLLQFSGTVFFAGPDNAMQVAQIGWDKESRFRLPAKVWREMMDSYYPNSAWLRLRRDVFDRLQEYKRSKGLATWEQAIDELLPAARKAVS